MRLRRRLVATMTAALLVAVTPACVSASSSPNTGAGPAGSITTAPPGTPVPTAPAPLAHGPFAVKTTTLTFVDTSRPTAAGDQSPAHPERTLETAVYEPDAPGAFPLIVFSHGLGGHPDKFTKLLTAWATAGFVVAAPAFPLTNSKVPGMSRNGSDLANQPADVSFVMDRLLERNRDATSPFHDRLRPDRIGVGGMSLGGATTYALTYHDCCRDDRIKASMVLSGARFPMGTTDFVMDDHVPLLIMHGDKDVLVAYQYAVDAYAAAKGPTWFATLDDFTHAWPFEDQPHRADAMVEKTTTDFWVGTLGGDRAALDRVGADATVPGMSTVQEK